MTENCPICGRGHIMRETWQQSFEYKGSVLTAVRTEEYCDMCGTLLQSPEICLENVRSEQRAKNLHNGLPAGAE